MTKVTVLRGYSASGKSTWARHQDAVIVSRDIIRQGFPGDPIKRVLSVQDEQVVTDMEVAAITAAVKRGRDVIVDNTNLVAKFARRYVDLAVALGADWEVKDFPADLQWCLEHNHGRDRDWVMPEVIQDQARRFPVKNWPVIEPSVPKVEFPAYVPDLHLPRAFGFDLDGTLAHIVDGGRSPYDATRYSEDVVDEAVREVFWALEAWGTKLVILTGRSEDYREVVEKWLTDNGIYCDALIMRPSGDTRKDAIVKSEMFDKHVAPEYNMLMHFDDRNRVVAALRAKGVKVAQVQEGDF